ncbi:hypothetical protein HNP81_003895 [Peribacillus huizhouensis]|uniref:Uncharacterized protein n=1 Tax=Peribacillus huizhouensis TaxID=1501239 RepID=A0ABR6CVE0_9BACI|nr:hypothetical protein [Peribacillus huizhouensis]
MVSKLYYTEYEQFFFILILSSTIIAIAYLCIWKLIDVCFGSMYINHFESLLREELYTHKYLYIFIKLYLLH